MWNIEGDLASWSTNGRLVNVALTKPSAGIFLTATSDNENFPRAPREGCSLLGVRDPAIGPPDNPLVDHYTRGDDLVALYDVLPKQNIQPQIYWRATRYGSLTYGVELILSVQTGLLDSQPYIATHSRLPHAYVQRLDIGPGVFLFRLPDATWSYVEMVHPTDYVDAFHNGDSIGFSLFNERLEKGVIRRGRLQGLFVPRHDDEAIAQECYEQFEASQLPLTT